MSNVSFWGLGQIVSEQLWSYNWNWNKECDHAPVQSMWSLRFIKKMNQPTTRQKLIGKRGKTQLNPRRWMVEVVMERRRSKLVNKTTAMWMMNKWNGNSVRSVLPCANDKQTVMEFNESPLRVRFECVVQGGSEMGGVGLEVLTAYKYRPVF